MFDIKEPLPKQVTHLTFGYCLNRPINSYLAYSVTH